MLVRNQRGQSLIEYVILVALIGVATMGIVRLLQETVAVNLANVIGALSSEKQDRKHSRAVTAHDLRKADFSNFMSGARSPHRDDQQE